MKFQSCKRGVWCTFILIAASCWPGTMLIAGVTRFVDAANWNSSPPYLSWATASAVIQDAIDVSEPGDVILVTNGIYSTGGRVVLGSTTNRVALDKAITLRSVNGPVHTIITGYKVPGITNGPGAIRCAYVTNGAVLSGFTLTGGATTPGESGGGVNCHYQNAWVEDCVITGNSALSGGGGMMDGNARNCTISLNSASDGGGCFAADLDRCVVDSNSANSGGGLSGCTANRCTIVRNSARYSGGTTSSELTNCVLAANTAVYGAGGARGGVLQNCLVVSNSAPQAAGVEYSALINCTVAANSATRMVGGAQDCRLTNCIVLGNSAPTNANLDGKCKVESSCISPKPLLGQGNLDEDPLFVAPQIGDFRLRTNSPCIDGGRPQASFPPTDLDEMPRVVGSSVDIGCFEVPEPAGQVAPHVVRDPSGQETTPGATVAFKVTAFGSMPLEYSWLKDGNPITGRTNSVLTIENAGPQDAGVYSAVISNQFGFATSRGATLSFPPPVTRYVDPKSSSPGAPFTNWTTAAHTIQEAIDEARPGDEVLVADGVYQTGGRVIEGPITNRVAIYKPVSVRSVNGARAAVIKGYQVPGVPNTYESVRCAYLTNGSSISGFTLTGGSGGSAGVWCASTSAVVANCLIISNTSVGPGGGATGGTLVNCLLERNVAEGGGGGAWKSVLVNCGVVRNRADHGGGIYDSTAINCSITGNEGFGARYSRLTNCIVYFNTADYGNSPNYENCEISYCCTVPEPQHGIGNFSADPRLSGAIRIGSDSPCRAAGTPGATQGTDIDGEPWLGLPSVGCDEFHAASATGAVALTISPESLTVAPNFPLSISAVVEGKITDSAWDFGDGTVASNSAFTTHSWTKPGEYTVALRAWSSGYPEGVSTSVVIEVTSGRRFVSGKSRTPLAPYSSWETAATNIQDAVDAASLGDEVVVGEGVYNTGGKAVHPGITNRVAIEKAIVLRSASGPEKTIIEGATFQGGYGGVRCVYLAREATLSGFTLQYGATGFSIGEAHYSSGGGVYSDQGLVTNCVLRYNTCWKDGAGAYGAVLVDCVLERNGFDRTHYEGREPRYGGGAAYSSLQGCILTGNIADVGAGTAFCRSMNSVFRGNKALLHGGGDFAGGLVNCTLVYNDAPQAGGASESMLYNCIAYYNNATNAPNHGSAGVYYSCTTPDANPNSVGGSFGNITAPPLLIDNRLAPGSPCINAGHNGFVASSNDFFRNRRISSGTVDIGAHEFQFAVSSISYEWLSRYQLPIAQETEMSDADQDGATALHEWLADTNPTNQFSVLKLKPVSLGSSNSVAFVTSSNRFYEVSFAMPGENLSWTNLPGWSGVRGSGGIMFFTDTNGGPSRVYRVRAKEPRFW